MRQPFIFYNLLFSKFLTCIKKSAFIFHETFIQEVNKFSRERLKLFLNRKPCALLFHPLVEKTCSWSFALVDRTLQHFLSENLSVPSRWSWIFFTFVISNTKKNFFMMLDEIKWLVWIQVDIVLWDPNARSWC